MSLRFGTTWGWVVNDRIFQNVTIYDMSFQTDMNYFLLWNKQKLYFKEGFNSFIPNEVNEHVWNNIEPDGLSLYW